MRYDKTTDGGCFDFTSFLNWPGNVANKTLCYTGTKMNRFEKNTPVLYRSTYKVLPQYKKAS